MRRITVLLICGFLLAASRASAQDDAVMSAMRDELDRSMKVRLEGLDKPYFIAYRISDQTHSTTAATLGSLTSSAQHHVRSLTVEVRVGNYTLDNSNFFSFRFGPAGVVRSFGNTVQLPLEDDYKEVRRQIWLATDAAYKKALESLARKRAALENKTRGDDLPDFSKEQPVIQHERPAALDFDPGHAETLVRQLSAIFREMPEIHNSSVEIETSNDYTRYLNSEGTEYTRATPFVGLTAKAGTQAPDGMSLGDAVAVYERSMAALPSQDQLATQIRDLGKRLIELRSAPLVERYNGPVLFEGQASAEVFGQAFAPKLVASRRPVTDNPQFEMLTSRVESPLQDRVGARVLPDWASVSDDPTQKAQNGAPLLGGYAVDDNGVAARRTVVVEKGILKTLLLSRAPVGSMTHSTGNERGFGVAPSNLFLTAQSALSGGTLKERLLSLAQQRAKPYAMLVRRLRNPLLGDPREMMTSVMGAFTPGLVGGNGILQNTVLTYEVFPDGHERLVRNAQLQGLNEASFKDLVAASSSQTVYSAPFLDFANMVMGMFSGGVVPNQSSPPVVSFAVPDLLFEDVTVKPPTGEVPKPPISRPPSGT